MSRSIVGMEVVDAYAFDCFMILDHAPHTVQVAEHVTGPVTTPATAATMDSEMSYNKQILMRKPGR